MRAARLLSLLILLLVLSLAPRPARAAWPNTPTDNVRVSTLAWWTNNPVSLSDGAGGVLVAWSYAASPPRVFVQKVSRDGVVAPSPWPGVGTFVSSAFGTGPGGETNPALVSDGAGGAIVAWVDGRSSSSGGDIYATHVRADGTIDPAWPANGRALCTAINGQSAPRLATDGSGGAFVSWNDQRNSPATGPNLYMTHVQANGALDPAWTANGNAIATGTGAPVGSNLLGDDQGGVYVAWETISSGDDIYLQHLVTNGSVATGFAAAGLPICTASGRQGLPVLVGDGQHGVIVGWYDERNTISASKAYATRVNALGVIDNRWPPNGRAMDGFASRQALPTMVSDGHSGALLAWEDFRDGTQGRIYAQHVLPSGGLDNNWNLDGTHLTDYTQDQDAVVAVADGAGGAIAMWVDLGSHDLFARRISALGVPDANWPIDGQAICIAAGDQTQYTLQSDGRGGAIACWTDDRTGTPVVWAQRVDGHGYLGSPEPAMAGVRDVPNDQGGQVKVSWSASYLDQASDPNVTAYDVLRSVPPALATARISRAAHVVSSPAALTGDRGALLATTNATTTTYWELLDSVKALHYVSGYSYVAPTPGDSVAGSNPRTQFMVVAHNGDGSLYWTSNPDSGYSVDNLPPVAPAPFYAQYFSAAMHLHWAPNGEADLAGYRLYHGATPDFVPDDAHLVSAQNDTGYVASGGADGYWKLAAIDVHGNTSGYATLLPGATTDVPPQTGLAFALEAATPNPVRRDAVTLHFVLPADGGATRLEVLDVAGRTVFVRDLSGLGAGRHDLALGATSRLATGLYLVRLRHGADVRTTRFVAL